LPQAVPQETLGRLAALAAALALAGAAQADDSVARGAYLARAGGCFACHTDHAGGGPPLAGGGAVETPFGTLYAPNLTPSEHGLGRWRERQFIDAMRRGRAPNGTRYYPAFPYAAYAGMSDQDVSDLWAYLHSLAPVDRPNRPHDLAFPFNQRIASLVWQLAFFSPRRFAPDPDRPQAWNRGAYLAETLLHCRECHTPRTVFGAPAGDLAYAGNRDWPGGKTVPNITPDRATGIGGWSAGDIVWLLKTGFKPDGNDVQGSMADLVEHASSHLTDDDLEAVASYVLSLAPIEYRVREKRGASGEGGLADDDYDYDFNGGE
jgi:mono/diheme cytochrome c family protein